MPVLLNVCSFHCRPILPAGLSFKPAEECQLFESFKVIPLFSCQGCAVCYLSCATTSISYHSCLHLSIAFLKFFIFIFSHRFFAFSARWSLIISCSFTSVNIFLQTFSNFFGSYFHRRFWNRKIEKLLPDSMPVSQITCQQMQILSRNAVKLSLPVYSGI